MGRFGGEILACDAFVGIHDDLQAMARGTILCDGRLGCQADLLNQRRGDFVACIVFLLEFCGLFSLFGFAIDLHFFKDSAVPSGNIRLLEQELGRGDRLNQCVNRSVQVGMQPERET